MNGASGFTAVGGADAFMGLFAPSSTTRRLTSGCRVRPLVATNWCTSRSVLWEMQMMFLHNGRTRMRNGVTIDAAPVAAHCGYMLGMRSYMTWVISIDESIATWCKCCAYPGVSQFAPIITSRSPVANTSFATSRFALLGPGDADRRCARVRASNSNRARR